MLPPKVRTNKIRQLRVLSGRTQRELVQQAGLNTARVSHLEWGIQPRPEELDRIAEALGCHPDDLRDHSQAVAQ